MSSQAQNPRTAQDRCARRGRRHNWRDRFLDPRTAKSGNAPVRRTFTGKLHLLAEFEIMQLPFAVWFAIEKTLLDLLFRFIAEIKDKISIAILTIVLNRAPFMAAVCGFGD